MSCLLLASLLCAVRAWGRPKMSFPIFVPRQQGTTNQLLHPDPDQLQIADHSGRYAVLPNIDEGIVEALSQIELRSAQSGCFNATYRRLMSDCEGVLLNEEALSYFALSLTNCFLASSGRSTIGCLSSKPILRCINTLSDHNHKIYHTFYIDTMKVCHHME